MNQTNHLSAFISAISTFNQSSMGKFTFDMGFPYLDPVDFQGVTQEKTWSANKGIVRVTNKCIHIYELYVYKYVAYIPLRIMRFHSYFCGSTQEPFKTLNDLYKSLHYGLEMKGCDCDVHLLIWGPIRRDTGFDAFNDTNPTNVSEIPRNTIATKTDLTYDHRRKPYIYTSAYVGIVYIYMAIKCTWHHHSGPPLTKTRKFLQGQGNIWTQLERTRILMLLDKNT